MHATSPCQPYIVFPSRLLSPVHACTCHLFPCIFACCCRPVHLASMKFRYFFSGWVDCCPGCMVHACKQHIAMACSACAAAAYTCPCLYIHCSTFCYFPAHYCPSACMHACTMCLHVHTHPCSCAPVHTYRTCSRMHAAITASGLRMPCMHAACCKTAVCTVGPHCGGQHCVHVWCNTVASSK